MKKNQYRYMLPDGRTLLSPKCLDYAIANSGERIIDLAKVSSRDKKQTTILAETFAGNILSLYNDDAEWISPEDASSAPANAAYHQNFCVMIGGEPRIRNGNKYVPLAAFIQTATKEELEYVLTQVCTQAALAHLELAKTQEVPG